MIGLLLLALASDPPFFRSIEAEASLEADGSITLTEKELIENPSTAPAPIKRRYWTDSDEKIALVSIIPSVPHKLEPWGDFKLTVPPGVTNYTITTRITGAVTPVWAVPRGVRSMDTGDIVVDPRERIREILPVWLDRGPNPRSRYLLDYQYFYPEQHETYVVNPSVSFGNEWKPAHAIKAGAIGTQIKARQGYEDSFRIRHLFDDQRSGAPAAIDLRKYAIRSGSIVAFPALAALIWLAYFAWVSLRGGATHTEIDDRWLRENVLNQPPEIIRAKWTGSPQTPEIEEFLRRLEKAGKITLDIETVNKDTDDEEDLVTVRLRVDRSRLSDYERSVIDALMPNSDEITSKEIEKAHAGQDFDPMDAAGDWLRREWPEKKRVAKAPFISRFLTGLMFAGGAVLLLTEAVRSGQNPIPFVATLVLCNFLIAMWPSIGNARAAMVLAIVPFVLLFAVVLLVQTITDQPPGEYASLGALLMTLAAFHGIVSGAAKRDARPPELVAAHDWFRAQPHVRDEWLPYLEALNLRQPQASNEEWGYALSTFADD
jgi:hypothetical protein